MLKKRSQSSMEYLILFGFVTLMIGAMIYMFFTEASQAQDSLASNQIRNIGMRIIEKTESIYYLGKPSRSTLKVVLPERVENVTISGRELVFYYRTTTNAIQEIVLVSLINMSGNISASSGIHFIQIEARDNYVRIAES